MTIAQDLIADELQRLASKANRPVLFQSTVQNGAVQLVTRSEDLIALGKVLAVDEAFDGGEGFYAWPVEAWVKHAMTAGDPLIVLNDDQKRTPIGFTSFSLSSWFDRRENTIRLELDLVSVFVLPDHRGRGASTLLRSQIVEFFKSYVHQTFAAVDRHLAESDVELDVAITYNAMSQEGSIFAQKAETAIREFIDDLVAQRSLGLSQVMSRT